MTAINIKTLGRSSITSGLAQLWRILSRLILTPLIISSIGFEGYGVWTLVFSVAAYVQMTNASFGLAYTKFTAECVRHRRYDELTHIIGSGMTGVGSIAVLGLLAAWLYGEPIMAWVGAPPEMVPDAALALVMILGVLVLRMTVGCTLEILGGLQRIDLTFRLNALSYLIEFVLSVPLLLWGYGLVGLAVGHAVGQVAINLAAYAMVRRRLPQVRISPIYVSRAGLRKVLSVGGRFQLLWAVNTIVLQGVKILISKLVGVEAVAVYELADKLINLGKTASEAVVAPLMPAFASLQAGGDKIRERLLFLKGSKADALMGGTSFTFLALFAPAILLLWTGEQVPESAWTLRVLAVGEAGLLLTSVVSSSLRAQGRVRREFTWAMLTTTIMVVLVIPLAPTLGFEGVIYSRLIAQLLGTGWYLRSYFRVSGLSWGEYLRGTRIPLLGVLLAATGGVVWLGAHALPPLWPPGLSARLGAAIEVAVWSVPYLGLLGVGVWKIYLNDDDRTQISTLVGAIVDKLRGRGPGPPAVIVVALAGLDRASPLVEAASVLGHAEAMPPGPAGESFIGGAVPRLILVQLGPDSDPRDQWIWLQDNRPDLVERLAFVGGRDDPFFEEVGAPRYTSMPDGETLRADWGEAAGAEADPPASH